MDRELKAILLAQMNSYFKGGKLDRALKVAEAIHRMELEAGREPEAISVGEPDPPLIRPSTDTPLSPTRRAVRGGRIHELVLPSAPAQPTRDTKGRSPARTRDAGS